MYIKIEDTKLETSEGLNFEQALRLIGTATLALMQGLDDQVKEKDAEHYDEVHGHIYDMFNIMAGNILDTFDHNRKPYTDLTAEAILKAENEILNEAAANAEAETSEEEKDSPE